MVVEEEEGWGAYMLWWGGVKGLLGFLGLIRQFNCELR